MRCTFFTGRKATFNCSENYSDIANLQIARLIEYVILMGSGSQVVMLMANWTQNVLWIVNENAVNAVSKSLINIVFLLQF